MSLKVNILACYGLLLFIWATIPLAIVWSVSDLNLMWALVIRFFLALPLAGMILFCLRIHFPVTLQAWHSYLAGAASLIGSQLFTYAATPYLSSGLIALMYGFTPIMAGFIGIFIFKRNMSTWQWGGLILAIIGLSTIYLGDSAQMIQPIGIILMLIGIFIYALSMYWVKKINAPVHFMSQATGSILISCLCSICVLPFIWHDIPTALPNLKSLIGLAYAVVMGSVIAMVCYFYLIQRVQAITLSLTTVITPLLALLVGAWLNHEHLTLMTLIGAGVIIIGFIVYFLKDLIVNLKFNSRD